MKTRPSFDEVFMQIARTLSTRSTCNKRSVGAVLVDVNNKIVGCGYNGAPAGLPHCIDAGCGEESGHCTRAVHAEYNAIMNSVDLDRAQSGKVFIYGASPCYRCAHALIIIGVDEVNYSGKLSDARAINYLKEAGVSIKECFPVGKTKEDVVDFCFCP